MERQPFYETYNENIQMMDKLLRITSNFDIVGREIVIGGRSAKMYFVDGFVKDDVLEKIMEYMMNADIKEMKTLKNAREFVNRYVPYVEVDVHGETETFCTYILSGAVGMIVDGYAGGIIIDARTYPVRGMDEPENDKVLRGSHDGFVETLIFNTAMIRRRMRDPELTMDIHKVGKRSKTDIVLCYLDNKVDKKILEKLKKKLGMIQVNTLSMSQESLAECLVKKQRYNPYPKVRYTERPDAATACIAEGKIILLVDNSPAAMILPTGFFEFMQDTNDYYFPPVVGTYLRLIRLIVFILTVFLVPTWLLLIKNPGMIPDWLSIVNIDIPAPVPIILQIILIEFVIDALKLASLNTPSSLSNSFSVIGALVLGEFAVTANLFNLEVLLFMAFVAVANFAQPSFELGYAFKLSRILIVVCTSIFNFYGYFAGVLIVLLLIVTTKTPADTSYLYPLFPFNAKALSSLFIRRPINKDNN